MGGSKTPRRSFLVLSKYIPSDLVYRLFKYIKGFLLSCSFFLQHRRHLQFHPSYWYPAFYRQTKQSVNMSIIFGIKFYTVNSQRFH